MLLDSIAEVLKRFVSTRRVGSRHAGVERPVAALKSIGFDDFLAIDMPPREMLLDPILPERSLAMLYAPRGIGKTLLALSMGLAVASGSRLLRWRAPRKRRVLYVDGEMPLVSLQERLRAEKDRRCHETTRRSSVAVSRIGLFGSRQIHSCRRPAN